MTLTILKEYCSGCGSCEAMFPGLLARLDEVGEIAVESSGEVKKAFHAVRACKSEPKALQIDDKEVWP